MDITNAKYNLEINKHIPTRIGRCSKINHNLGRSLLTNLRN